MQFTTQRLKKSVAMAAAVGCVLGFGLTGCSTGGPSGPTIQAQAPSTVSGDIEFWHFFTDREAEVLQNAVDSFEKKYPDVHVTVKSGQDDEKMRQAIAAGQPIDVGLSYSTDQVGPLCSSGAFVDLQPFIDRDKVDMTQIAEVAQSYTAYEGKRCSLPALADTYALYYNTDMFAAAGITTPPKTLDELTDDAVKLTTFNADGSIKTLGFMPLLGYYENSEPHWAVMAQAGWLNKDGTSAVGSDAAWQKLYAWQKNLIDKLGGYKLVSDFQAGLGQEFSEQNDFQTGRVAMNIDGEFRTAFIADQAPDVKYATAPLPLAADKSKAYGAGYITGNVLGIGKGSTNPEAAWALVKYLGLDTDAQVLMGNGLKNVPTVKSALTSPDLEVSDEYKVFLEVYQNPNSQTAPASIIGSQYQTILGQFSQKWQSGDASDVASGLAEVDQQINDAVALGSMG
ncbi:MAG: ABC transporter substrate-binding protein [Propionibacteriaceae bacterium]|jgi:multiple sugar transport system substrate-binding protein|nr:ABC transporter substrate-binding protein [Propionibacteriaceae bacterium]